MLTIEQVERYRMDGYCVSPVFLSAEEVSRLLSAIDDISKDSTLMQHDKTRVEMEPHQPPTGKRVRRIYEPCTYYTPFRELSESVTLLSSVEQLLGPNLVFHYSKINMKPPEIGSVVEWHQDLAYYPLTNTDSLAILFYLDDTNVGNGCLQVLPGRQSGSPLDHTLNGFFQGRITERVDASRAVSLTGPAGTAIFMNALVPHASATNTSPRPRRTLILSYRAADAYPVYAGETTVKGEMHVRHVRGERSLKARFTLAEFPIPMQERATASLYELQELSRKKLSESEGPPA